MDTYAKATSKEKAVFTNFSKLLKENSPTLQVEHRELKGAGRKKYIYVLAKNLPLIHTLEFQVSKEETKRITLVVSRASIDSEFYKKFLKMDDSKSSYGGIVLSLEVSKEEDVPTLLKKIDTLSQIDEDLVMDPKRTYSDPPQGWGRSKTLKDPVKETETE